MNRQLVGLRMFELLITVMAFVGTLGLISGLLNIFWDQGTNMFVAFSIAIIMSVSQVWSRHNHLKELMEHGRGTGVLNLYRPRRLFAWFLTTVLLAQGIGTLTANMSS